MGLWVGLGLGLDYWTGMLFQDQENMMSQELCKIRTCNKDILYVKKKKMLPNIFLSPWQQNYLGMPVICMHISYKNDEPASVFLVMAFFTRDT